MKIVYVDEAGTSAQEPRTLVVGIVADGDSHIRAAERELERMKDLVPAPYRDGFIAHATDIWNNREYRQLWTLSDRVGWLCALMEIPRKLRMPITLGTVRRDIDPPGRWNNTKLTREQGHHMLSMVLCTGQADRVIRQHGHPDEVGIIVAEDVPELRSVLGLTAQLLRAEPVRLESNQLVNGDQHPTGVEFKVQRIRNAMHFAKKNEEPLLQLADACAFGLRRYFAGSSHGDEFATAIVGKPPAVEEYSGPSSATTFFFR